MSFEVRVTGGIAEDDADITEKKEAIAGLAQSFAHDVQLAIGKQESAVTLQGTETESLAYSMDEDGTITSVGAEEAQHATVADEPHDQAED